MLVSQYVPESKKGMAATIGISGKNTRAHRAPATPPLEKLFHKAMQRNGATKSQRIPTDAVQDQPPTPPKPPRNRTRSPGSRTNGVPGRGSSGRFRRFGVGGGSSASSKTGSAGAASSTASTSSISSASASTGASSTGGSLPFSRSL